LLNPGNFSAQAGKEGGGQIAHEKHTKAPVSNLLGEGRGDTSFVECLCPMEPNSVLPRLGHHMGAKTDTERYFSGGSDG